MSDIRKVAILALSVIVTVPIAAQEHSSASVAAETAQFKKERRQLIADNLQLTDTEAKDFWPIYDRLEQDITVMLNKRTRIIAEFGENYDQMTDDMARKLLMDYMNLEEQRTQLWKTYFKKFEKVLPIKKLARYYQIESKIRAFVDAGIAEEIPLIK